MRKPFFFFFFFFFFNIYITTKIYKKVQFISLTYFICTFYIFLEVLFQRKEERGEIKINKERMIIIFFLEITVSVVLIYYNVLNLIFII